MVSMEEGATSLLIGAARRLFEEKFGSSSGSVVVFAPGRVNLIGEHTDYNDGFVMPLALSLKTVVVGRGRISSKGSRDTTRCRVVSESFEEETEFQADERLAPGRPQWANYVKGVVAAYLKDVPNGKYMSFDAAVASDVPPGAGLSSSAALEVGIATFLEEIIGVKVTGVEKALRCQSADHVFLHSPCGIMDQFVSSLAQEGSTLLIDCRSKEFETVPLTDDGVLIVVANSGVKHKHAEGAYGKRVEECRQAVKAIQRRHPEVQHLRDASMAWVREVEGEVDDKVFQRARHVVSEDQRTLCCAMALRRRDYRMVGTCMLESHESLRDDYKVSIPELDLLVSIASRVKGVYGSRMTGGGFGGCTVTLVKSEAANELMDTLRREYLKETSREVVCFESKASPGAGVLVPSS